MTNPRSKAKNFVKDNLLTILTVVGVVGGTLSGLGIKYMSESAWTQREIMYIQYPGDLFLR